MSNETVMLSGRVPKELKELVDADRRDNQEVLRAALWREFGGERRGDLERRVEEKERRISMIRTEKNERERELEREESELSALRSKLDQTDTRKEAKLSEARDALSGVPHEADNPAIKNWARKLDMTPSELLEEL